jgi:predicted nucleic acid-binding protein
MNSRVCIDASLAIEWVIPTQNDLLFESLLQSWDRNGTDLISPPLFNAEVSSAIRRFVYLKKLLPGQGEKAFLFFQELDVRIINPPELTVTAFKLAKQFNLPVCYDTQYVALAELADCELWTADKRLANAVLGKTNRVNFAGDAGKI